MLLKYLTVLIPYLYSVLATLELVEIVADFLTVQNRDFKDPLKAVYPLDASLFVKDGEEFDFIVVGVGTAGSILVSRLTACGFKVLAIEAGGDPSLASVIPGLNFLNLGGFQDYRYSSVTNGKSCLGMQQKFCPISRGKLLGGSSGINYMIYTRGSPEDYNNWGVQNWTYADLEKYFIMSERNLDLDKLPDSSKPVHGSEGPVWISRAVQDGNKWRTRIIEAFQDLGVPLNEDFNGVSQIGTGQTQSFIANGGRSFAAHALIRTAKWNNLTLLKNSKGLKINFDHSNRATSVKVLVGGKIKKVFYARKEIILSAGAIETPAILMRSGIGPRQHLMDLGIPVVSDLPVGQKLYDHVLCLVPLKCDKGFGIDIPNFKPLLIKGVDIVEWLAKKTGLMASPGFTDIGNFLNSKCYSLRNQRYEHKEECLVPDIQFVLNYIDKGVITAVPFQFKTSSGYNDNIIEQIRKFNVENAVILHNVIALQPKSSGHIELDKSNIEGPPIIYPNYLDDIDDVTTLVNGLKITIDLLETPTFKENNATLIKIDIEECDNFPFGSDKYLECYSRHMSSSVFHGQSTTPLLEVVDENLKVYGVKNLRVADGGIMKYVPSATTAAACMAIGEKMADILCNEYSSSLGTYN